MFEYMTYGPYICMGVVLAILFVLWAFWGGKTYDFVGLAPLDPNTCGSYTGSIYNWGNITPAIGYDPIEGHPCIPQDIACIQNIAPLVDTNICLQDTPIPNNNTTTIPDTVLIDVPNPNNVLIHNVPDNVLINVPINIPNNAVIHNNPNYAVIHNNPNNAVIHNVPNNVLVNNIPNRMGSVPKAKKPGRMVSRGEKICCETMEKIYGVKFTTVRPTWLTNPETGKPLELDCYNDELKIAVEYNGIQHYEWPNFTNQSQDEFIDQTRRDRLKLELCDQLGVYLITVPHTIQHNDIPKHIMSLLPETIRERLEAENIFVDGS